MLQIAKILKSNGIDGGLLIGVRDIEVGQIDLQEPVFIEFDGLPVPFFIQDLQQRGSAKAIVHLNDITSLEDAEEVVGRAVYIEGEWEEEEEMDFTGWTLLNRGERVGTVTGTEPIPGNLCIWVEKCHLERSREISPRASLGRDDNWASEDISCHFERSE